MSPAIRTPPSSGESILKNGRPSSFSRLQTTSLPSTTDPTRGPRGADRRRHIAGITAAPRYRIRQSVPVKDANEERSGGVGRTSTLVVTRERRPWRDRLRRYWVVLDGLRVGALAQGEAASFKVDPGEHRLRLEIDWARSNELTFTAAPDTEADFVCQPAGGRLGFYRALFHPTAYITLRQEARTS